MKILLTFILLSFALHSKSQNCSSQKDSFLKNIEKKLIKVKPNLYVSKHEVSNSLFKIFLDEMKHHKELVIYDSTYFKKNTVNGNEYYSPFTSYYKEFPVVNISFESAMLFCNWLTEKYNSYDKRGFSKIQVDLPTEDEWLQIARGNDTSKIFPWSGAGLKNYKGAYLANFKAINNECIYFDKENKNYKIYENCSIPLSGRFLTPVSSFVQTDSEICNLCGNASEMLKQKGKSKGGSWKTTGYYLRLDYTDNYSAPQEDLGFRTIVRVVEQ